MKLKDKTPRGDANSMFVKFTTIGDSCEGEFVEFNEDVPSRYGDEDNLILRGDKGPLCIRCPTKLKAIVKSNLESFVRGARVKVTFTAEIPSSKGNPMKDFDVEVDPPPAGYVPQDNSSGSTENNIPF